MRVLSVCATLAVCCSAVQAQIAVVNGASFRAEQPVSPGSYVSAFGTFAGVTSTTAAVPYPKTLGGVSVTVDGAEAPVQFVSQGQINFIVPGAISPGLKSIQVRTSSGTVSGSMRVISSSPGIIIKDSTTQVPPKGAILNQDSTENTPSNPVRRGQVIQIFAIGPGALDGTIPDGAPAPRSPLVRTKSTPQVYIGGVEAKVDFSGMAPDYVGLWQINAFIPDQFTSGQPFMTGRVTVRVYMDGVDSNEVTVFVAQ